MKTEKASGEVSPSSNMSNAAAVPLTSHPAQTHAADPEGSNEDDFHTDSLSMVHVRSIELLLQKTQIINRSILIIFRGHTTLQGRAISYHPQRYMVSLVPLIIVGHL